LSFQEQLDIAIRLGVAALGGLAVGTEREWSARIEEKAPRFAGVRTFMLIGLIGALSVEFIQLGFAEIGTGILAAGALLIVVAYTISAVRKDLESTTEFAAILVLAAGALAGTGKLALASALNAFTALVLVEKSRIHSLVFRIQSEELSAGFRFAVLALVVLPLLPEGPFGPAPGIRPRELWILVLLFSGISFAGFVARRAAGPERGYGVAGLLGGLISSTVVTLNFSRESRTNPLFGQALGFGVIAACTVLPLRVGVLTLLLNSNVGLKSLPALMIPFLVGLLLCLHYARRTTPVESKFITPRNPLRLFSAIQMVLAFQAALYVLRWGSTNFGSAGVMITAAFVGLTDVDTLTFMMSRQNNLSADIASNALIIGVIANTLMKMALVLVIGAGSFRRVAGIGLSLLAVATAAGLLL
jgi:uncharacterized membrane protein (DUF4010 family)